MKSVPSNMGSLISMKIRPEQRGDHDKIRKLTAEAFEPIALSDGSEPKIIDELRRAGDLTLSLVAEDNGCIVGHVAFSPIIAGQHVDNWYGLGPVAVRLDVQRTGVGSALITEGLKRLIELGAAGCALVGNPNYYKRFDFISSGKVFYQEVPPEFVQFLCFNAEPPVGELQYRPAFSS